MSRKFFNCLFEKLNYIWAQTITFKEARAPSCGNDTKPEFLSSRIIFEDYTVYKNRLFYSDDTTYPLHNIEKLTVESEEGEYYMITLAVAGFSKDELSVNAYNNNLNILGRKIPKENKSLFLYKGISNRGFEKNFELSDSMVVKNSVLKNGLLNIYILRYTLNKNHSTKIEIMDENNFITHDF